MKFHGTSRGTLAIAAATIILATSPGAFASKEKFVRDKPHVTVSEEDEDTAETTVRKPKEKVEDVDASENKKNRRKKKPKSPSKPESGKET